MKYERVQITKDKWVIHTSGKDYTRPLKSITFALDTETLVYLDGKIVSQKELLHTLKDVPQEEKRKRVTNVTWSWQVYDEVNGFLMTNDFYTLLNYLCLCGAKFGWVYNATFDFAQIDYEILATGKDKWKPHVHKEKVYNKDLYEDYTTKQDIIDAKSEIATTNMRIEHYNKHQPWTYESLHNDCGTRYAYKLWIPYKNLSSHKYVHAVELHDFMKLCGGGLAHVLNDLDVRDNENNPIRKLKMDYQAVDTNNLSQEDIMYCENDVKGLYFAVKKFSRIIEEQTDGENSIFGENTNIMTSGGLAKREMLRSLYENVQPYCRVKKFQKHHKITIEQDKWVRNYSLYRGGITYLNPRYKGKLIKNKLMYRYDVNSEYPYVMYSIRDLIGYPFVTTLKKWNRYSDTTKNKYECIYILERVSGVVKNNMLGLWYDPLQKDYVDIIDEDFTHLIFERELEELSNWYDLDYTCTKVILIRRGKYAYRDFVTKNYELKAKAKKDKNKTLQQYAKLILNSCYGKLSERVERGTGHYELNEETGAIHFIQDGIEVSSKSLLSVFVGSLVTCFARCYIMKMIRTICKNPSRDFVYIDTDSIHCFCNYDKADAFKLGTLKLETTCEAIKYLLPKTYCDVTKIGKNGLINLRDIEIHSKGISVSAVMTELLQISKVIDNEHYVTLKDIDNYIAFGKKYVILSAMNVKGGKVLLPTEKYLARWELANDDEKMYTNNRDGNYLSER